MLNIILICLCAAVCLSCLYIVLIQFITENRRQTKDRVAGLTKEEKAAADKKGAKKQLKLGKNLKKKKQVSSFAKPRKGLQEIEDELYNLGSNMHVQTFVTLWIAVTIGGAILLMMAGIDVIMCFVFAIVAAVTPYVYIRIKKKKRREVLETQLIDGIMLICNVLRAGHSFETAMNNVATDMEGPIAEEFERVLRETQRGIAFDTSMNAMSERIESPDLDMLCQTILIQRRVGGNLAEVLENIADTIQSRLNLKEEIKTLTSAGKLSGYIIGALPIILVLLISVISPEYTKPLFSTTVGLIMLGISLAMEAIGFFFINRIVDIDY